MPSVLLSRVEDVRIDRIERFTARVRHTMILLMLRCRRMGRYRQRLLTLRVDIAIGYRVADRARRKPYFSAKWQLNVFLRHC